MTVLVFVMTIIYLHICSSSWQSVVCFDSNVLGWRTLASSWLKTRRKNEGSVCSTDNNNYYNNDCLCLIQCLQKLFESAVDQVSQFVLYKLEYVMDG